MEQDIMLQAAGIEVHRGSRVVLKDTDFRLERGEVVVLAGPNGSGKTTLLEACAGILPLTSGSVIWRMDGDEERVVRDSDGRRNEPPPMGLTLQSDGMCGEETVEERLQVSLSVSGRSSDENTVSQMLSEWGLEHRRADRVSQLSGGQRRRLAVLCGLAPAALSADSRVVLLDEPSEGLDESGRALLAGWLRALARDGHSVLVATHDEGVVKCADRVLGVQDENLTESLGSSEGEPSRLPEPSQSIDSSTHGSLIRWAIRMEMRNPVDTTGRATPALVALLLAYALVGEIDLGHAGSDLLAALVLVPAFITVVVSPALVRRLAEEDCGRWWNAMVGPAARPTYSLIGASILLPLPLTYISWFVLADSSDAASSSQVLRWLWLPAVVMIDVAAAAAALHLLVADLRRASAAAASLLLLVLVWPFLQLTDALSVIMTDGMSFGLGMGDPLVSCIIASLISILVWAVAIYLPDA
ncbi:MAG: ABC transporter ATP-binding protein [Candidatus Thermoplasmatota archaeon]|nr:ABC transporter ATP-binding protein [Candidatus Thermoplasmatota archaeon]